jgi:tight adherence protein B
MKKKERMQKLEQQLPEGLDFLARALKAGHAFTGSVRLATENFEDPLGTELERTLDEINFGISTDDALKNLLDRVDSQDMRYFVVSVILQRETGGNLAEVMESIAHIIRERFKFRDKVRVLSAEGKFSGVLLCVLPFLVLAYLAVANPVYLTVLFKEPVGQVLAVASAFMMCLGIFLMRKTTKIEI